MEKLIGTFGGAYYQKESGIQKLLGKLYEYEYTDLTPKQILVMEEELAILKAKIKEGWLVPVPVPVGTTVFGICTEIECDSDCYEDGNPGFCEACVSSAKRRAGIVYPCLFNLAMKDKWEEVYFPTEKAARDALAEREN